MATGTGLDAQIGVAEESTYGTFVSPTRFYEFNSQSLRPIISKIRSMPIGNGRYQKSSRVRTYNQGGEGDLELDVVNQSMGLLFKHILGDHSIAQPDDTNDPDVYQQTIVPDSNGLKGLSLSVQAGVPATDGTVHPFNFTGGKITSWELACALDEILSMTGSFDFANSFEMDTALGSATYPSDLEPFIFVDGSATIGGDSVSVSNATVAGENALATGRRFLGNTKKEPLANGEFPITGTLATEFESQDFVNDFINGAVAELVLTFTAGVIAGGSGSFNYELQITIPEIEFTGEVPVVGGTEVVPHNLPYKALWNETDDIITVLYTSTDDAA